jgi:hypothetical protein
MHASVVDKINLTKSMRDDIFKLLKNPEIDSKESIPSAYVACAEILEPRRNRVFVPTRRLYRLAELIPWNRFWAPQKFKNTVSGRAGMTTLFLQSS